jgi:hypothetical protein
MIMKIELPDNTLAGFVNFVAGDGGEMRIGTIALSTEEIKNEKATYKTCKTVGESEY